MNCKNQKLTTLQLLSCSLWLSGSCIAGPPLATDDPGILNPGSWEIILAIAGEDHPDGNDIHAPLLDLSVGVSENTQVSLFLPHAVINRDNLRDERGLEFASFAYKWRFYSADNWECAVATNYTLPISHAIIEENGPDDIRVMGLPLLIAHTSGKWTWNSQLGWNTGSDGSNFFDYGIAITHPLGKSLNWMVEIFGNAEKSFHQNSLNYQLGIDYELNSNMHLLMSIGSRIKSVSRANEHLNYSFYLGFQWLP